MTNTYSTAELYIAALHLATTAKTPEVKTHASDYARRLAQHLPPQQLSACRSIALSLGR